MLDKQFYWNRSRRSDRTNLGNHALESDVFIVYLLFTLPQFSICHYQTRKKKKKINLKPHIPSQKITWSQITNNTKNEKRKVRTFGIGEIGVFSNFSSRHRLEKLVGNKGENGWIQRFWNFPNLSPSFAPALQKLWPLAASRPDRWKISCFGLGLSGSYVVGSTNRIYTARIAPDTESLTGRAVLFRVLRVVTCVRHAVLRLFGSILRYALTNRETLFC